MRISTKDARRIRMALEDGRSFGAMGLTWSAKNTSSVLYPKKHSVENRAYQRAFEQRRLVVARAAMVNLDWAEKATPESEGQA
jgi:hypothetical protein